MRRAFPWILSAVLLVAFVSSFSELQRVRKRFGEVTRHAFHDHQEVRAFMIRSALSQVNDPVVFVGDSITEAALLPAEICGHPVVNAGIGSATAESYAYITKGVFGPVHTAVVAIGTNNALRRLPNFAADYEMLLSAIPARRLILVEIPEMGIASDVEADNRIIAEIAAKRGAMVVKLHLSEGAHLPDGIHLSAIGYKQWLPPIIRVIDENCH